MTTTEERVIDFVDLYDFDVQILLSSEGSLETVTVKDIVREWFETSFQNQLLANNLVDGYASLDSVILIPTTLQPENGSQESDSQLFGQLVTTEFQGAVLMERTKSQMALPTDLILQMQEITLDESSDLLNILQRDIGKSVLDVRAYLRPESTKSSSNKDSLEIVILVSIAVAGMAFIFLLFAIYWAWSYDRKNRDAYLSSKGGPDKTGSDSGQAETHEEESIAGYPSQIGGSVLGKAYAESVMTDDIEEDIRTSLAAYKGHDTSLLDQSRVSSLYTTSRYDKGDDNVSVSSMGSYGFSLAGESQIVNQSHTGISSRSVLDLEKDSDDGDKQDP